MVKLGLIPALCAFAAPAEACRLALVLAVDVSSSVDATEDKLQRAGLAAALIDPAVQEAFFSSPDPVAISVFEWSGRYNQDDIVPWTLIEDQDDLLRVAQAITNSTRSHDDFPTAMGYALGHAAVQLREMPHCLFHTIDLAGDGINNEGFSPPVAYRAFPFAGVTVNGLVVQSAANDATRDPLVYYQDQVIRGPGAFVEVANGFDDYQDAMRRKLIREVSAQIIGGTFPISEQPG